MRKVILAAAVLIGIGGTGAKADPILTPIIAASLTQAGIVGGFTVAGATITYASLATFAITAGPALPVSSVGRP
jgi:hypothetical protein